MGIALTGTEISLPVLGALVIKESYAHIYNGEIILKYAHPPYEQGNRFNVEPLLRGTQAAFDLCLEIFKLAG